MAPARTQQTTSTRSSVPAFSVLPILFPEPTLPGLGGHTTTDKTVAANSDHPPTVPANLSRNADESGEPIHSPLGLRAAKLSDKLDTPNR